MRASARPVRLAIAAVLASTGAVMSQPQAPSRRNDDGWCFPITPYAFIPMRTGGAATVTGADANLDRDLRDVLGLLNGALVARAEAWRGNFGLVTEGCFVSIAGGGSVRAPGPVAGRPGADFRPDAWQQTSVRFGREFCSVDFPTTRQDGRFGCDVFRTGPFLAITS